MCAFIHGGTGGAAALASLPSLERHAVGKRTTSMTAQKNIACRHRCKSVAWPQSERSAVSIEPLCVSSAPSSAIVTAHSSTEAAAYRAFRGFGFGARLGLGVVDGGRARPAGMRETRRDLERELAAISDAACRLRSTTQPNLLRVLRDVWRKNLEDRGAGSTCVPGARLSRS